MVPRTETKEQASAGNLRYSAGIMYIELTRPRCTGEQYCAALCLTRGARQHRGNFSSAGEVDDKLYIDGRYASDIAVRF